MSNQVINPIIQHFSEDTLRSSCDCLAYMGETMRPDLISEISAQAKEGFQFFIDCVKQAVQFEADRAKIEENSPRFDDLSAFEADVFRQAHKDHSERERREERENRDGGPIAFTIPTSVKEH